MTRPSFILVAAALLVLTLQTNGARAAPPSPTRPAATESDESVRKALTELKAKVVQAFIHRDRAALERIYADDYVATDSEGKVRTKKDELAQLGADPDRLESGRYDVVAIRVYGNVAVMSGQGHLTWRKADGSTRRSDYYSFNVFEKRNGEWKYVAAFLP